jgi:PleD family two-component response regulator
MTAMQADKAAPAGIDVLVIDDSELMRASLTRALSEAGLSAVGLASPVGATRTILRESVRVVLIDLDMPSMTGDKLISLLRQNKRLHRLKLILMSGEHADVLDKLAGEVGADAAIAKVEGPEAICRLIARMLGHR